MALQWSAPTRWWCGEDALGAALSAARPAGCVPVVVDRGFAATAPGRELVAEVVARLAALGAAPAVEERDAAGTTVEAVGALAAGWLARGPSHVVPGW